MQREKLNQDLATIEVNRIVRTGIVNTQSALFDFCSIAKNRIQKLTRITDIIEDKLLSEETLAQIQSLPWQQQLPVYHMINEIVGNMTSFLQKMHLIASDAAKTEYLKKVVEELSVKIQESENVGRFKLEDVDPKNIEKVVSILEFEMKRRSKAL